MYSFIPEGYQSVLSVYDTQKAISLLKRIFIDRLAGELNLYRVSAPLFVPAGTGINDDLNGVERPVAFDIANTEVTGQVVHSLAKWKRMALKRYDFFPGKGLYTDMNAIRRDEEMDNLHSVYVDQWDWEKVIQEKDRNVDFLKSQVDKIISALCDTQMTMQSIYPALSLGGQIKREIKYITAQELEDLYPNLTPKQREDEITKQYGTVFLMGIGGALHSGKPHDGRAPDYDDWNLNGDILIWYEPLKCTLEVSSMGIRVSPESLSHQLKLAHCEDRCELLYHKMLLNGELPYTIGGGIGQSRISMLLLNKAHIGEVQSSIWDQQTINVCEKAGVMLL